MFRRRKRGQCRLRLKLFAGNYVLLDIGGGRFASYAHFQPNSLKVKVGDRVKLGQVLGLVGNSGNSDLPHLHFHITNAASRSVPKACRMSLNHS
jgi:murein DD-endopeptidase MepM/ murein hydrolase activator NlpD